MQVFTQFNLFVTGIGVHYEPSIVVKNVHQASASVGERMRPHIFIRAADARPYELQDLLPADARSKIIVFAGDTSDEEQLSRIRALADEMTKTSAFVARFGHGSLETVFDFITISSATKYNVLWTDLPELFSSHWSK